MARRQRLQIRAATRIHEQLAGRELRAATPLLPLDLWRQLTAATRQVAVSEERGWHAAGLRARHKFQTLAASLCERLVEGRRRLDGARHLLQIQSPRDLLADLVALEDEFVDVELDLQQKTLAFSTDRVVLEHIDLGRFRVLLHWDDLPDPGAYEVQALDPHPAASDHTTTHPHVRDSGLCEGEGRISIRSALAAGRILDFALLVRSVLHTYNAGSAYVPLSRWHGSSCADCGYLASEEESTCCDLCSAELCCDCPTSCGTCGRSSCADCRDSCGQCDESHCASCLRACAGCDESCCRNCLTDDLCDRCREAEVADLPSPNPETTHDPSETPIAA